MQGYRQGLITKYGEKRVLILESMKNKMRKYADFELIELTKYYKALGDKLSTVSYTHLDVYKRQKTLLL